MASEVVSMALETVRYLLIEEAKFLSGVSDQVREVQAELIQMQCFLKDADKRQLKDAVLQNYVREIRHLAYRTEDVLEEFAIEVESRREGRGFRKAVQRSACILCEGGALHKVGSEIANIKANINSLTTSLQTYGVREMSSEDGQSSNAVLDQNQLRLRQTYPHQVEEYFVGMKDDIRHLLSLINDDENRSHRVISIHGMGGLGKTTLARKIYNHIEIQCSFKAFAWVSITQQYNAITIFRDILKQLLPKQEKDRVDRMEERELVGELYEVQKKTKCLVVLDDLWEIEHWKCLSPAFPFAEADSKILITTRNQKLAEIEFPYALKLLNEDEGWELLQKTAFAKRDTKDLENDPKLEAIGRKIVRKCGKLPLAISVLGGILSQKNSHHEWEMVNKDVDTYLRLSEDSKEGYGAVLQVLALSYDELPYHLKPCFLYLGQFREDEEINAEMLYLMWIAEGMVSSDHRGAEETLTNVAERYLYEMARRSMVELKLDEFSTYPRIESCYLHDLMMDFCMARAKEVEFFQLLDFRGGKNPLLDSSAVELRSPSRCFICTADNDSAIINMALEAMGQLRSLVVAWSDHCISFPQVICDSSKFKCLRVLKFEGYDFEGRYLPRWIKKLIHLRLLSLNGCRNLRKLPPSIGQLQYLQTLDLRLNVHGIRPIIPNVLWKLKRLRHLYLGPMRRTQKGKLSFSGLSKLETLVGFNSDNAEFKDVLELRNLRRLDGSVEPRGKNDVSEILNYLKCNQNKLREVRLVIYFSSFSIEEDGIFPIKDFLGCPSLYWLDLKGGAKLQLQKIEPPLIPSNLIELTLSSCEIEGDPMEFLGKCSNLKRLELSIVELRDRKMVICDSNAFPKLIYLYIVWTNIEKWVVAKGSMPSLSNLSISDCLGLEMIPDGLRFISTLKVLEILGMPKEFNERVQQGGVDYDKISHVPRIQIYY